MPQDKNKIKKAARKVARRVTGAVKRVRDLANRKKSRERQERLIASKAKKRGVKKAPQEGPVKQKRGKVYTGGLQKGKLQDKGNQVVRINL